MNSDFVSLDVMKKIAADDALQRRLAQDPIRALSEVGVFAQSRDIPQQIMLPASLETALTDPNNPTDPSRHWAGFIG